MARGAGGRARLVDGFGISPANRASPRNVVGLLRAGDLEGKLPVAGRDGTVAARMKGTRGRCAVKTGTRATSG